MRERLTSHELREFFAGPYRGILGAVTLVTGSPAAAEDAVHEALARAWERRHRIDHLDRWVVTVALNIARNHRRKLGREVPADEQFTHSAGVAHDRSVRPADPAAVDLRRALAELPRRQREVVALHYYLDLPVADVADLIGLSPGGVKHALFRARGSLAPLLAVEEETTS